MRMLLVAHVQSALHLTPAEGGLRNHGNLRSVPLGGIGQVWAPVEGLQSRLRPHFHSLSSTSEQF